MRYPFSEAAAKAAGFLAERSNGMVRFFFEGQASRRGESVTVSIDANDNLDLIVERSSSHRELARKLGAIDEEAVKKIEKEIHDSFKSS